MIVSRGFYTPRLDSSAVIKPGRPVKDISIRKGDTIEKIFDQMSKSGGFESRNLVDGLIFLLQ